MEWIAERVGNRVPLVGVGNIHTADEALSALNTNVSMIALGRELIIEPDWVEKIESGNEEHIAVHLTKEDQERLVIPDPLWNMILGVPGWFPVLDSEESK